MHAAITYDLREDYLQQGYTYDQTAEFDVIETIEAIEKQLQRHGCVVERIGNIKQLVTALTAGKRWDFVFNIAEGLHGLARETQVPALLEAYEIPYVFSDAVTLAITQDKSMAKRIVRDAGIATPAFAVIEQLQDLSTFTLPFPVFAKPLAEGTSKGIKPNSYVKSLTELKHVTEYLLQRYHQPVLVECFLPGREFTVGIFGTGEDAEALGVMEIMWTKHAEQHAYTFENKRYAGKIDYRIADDKEAKLAGQTALKVWKLLRCKDGGRVDLRSDQFGVPQFLEVNPIAGLQPDWSDLIILMKKVGLSYEDCLDRILNSFFKRTQLNKKYTASNNALNF